MPDDRFEARLQAGLRAYADARVRPVDPFTLARSVVEAGRPLTPLQEVFGGRSGRLTLLWLAAILALLMAGITLVASGGLTPKRPIAVAAPTTSPTVVQLEAYNWQLDIPGSGITIASPQPFGWASELELHRGTFSTWTGAGGGCDVLVGTYAATGADVAFTVPISTSDGCTYLGTEQLRPRLARVVSYEISLTNSCVNPSAEPTTLFGAQLCLLDRSGAVVLAYRAVSLYSAKFPGQPGSVPTP